MQRRRHLFIYLFVCERGAPYTHTGSAPRVDTKVNRRRLRVQERSRREVMTVMDYCLNRNDLNTTSLCVAVVCRKCWSGTMAEESCDGGRSGAVLVALKINASAAFNQQGRRCIRSICVCHCEILVQICCWVYAGKQLNNQKNNTAI